ncbi:MAG: hypothetical protein SWY16_25155, partial [Cyanobacteriota bacterium]|nr:hypothetical protein [Cyanobacteriota bacterium]
MLFTNALPAMAFGEMTSKPSDGVTSLDSIQQKSKDVTKSDPRSEKEMKNDAPGGLNRVQGAADREKMIKPEDAKNIETPTDRIENFLEEAL